MERLALYLSIQIPKSDFVTSTSGSENKTTTDNLNAAVYFLSPYHLCHRQVL